MTEQRLRFGAGIALIAVLIGMGIMVVPPYVENMRFQSFLDDLVEHPQAPEIMQAAAVNRAAQLGLPVKTGDVRVSRQGRGVRVEILYVVRVEFPLYTVDLHFHPSAALTE